MPDARSLRTSAATSFGTLATGSTRDSGRVMVHPVRGKGEGVRAPRREPVLSGVARRTGCLRLAESFHDRGEFEEAVLADPLEELLLLWAKSRRGNNRDDRTQLALRGQEPLVFWRFGRLQAMGPE